MSEHHRIGYEKAREALEARRRLVQQEAQARYAAAPKRCPACGKPLPYEKRHLKFCNRSCAVSRNNTVHPKRVKQTCACRQCGGPTRDKNTYCDICLSTGAGLHRIKRLEDANSDQTRKRYLLRTRPHRCQACGRTEWEGHLIPLEMDHIDGDTDNNVEGNLRLICPNCHALSPFSRGRNRGRGRTRQRVKNQRYAAGLKY